jgi:hypothetical protein
MLLKMGCILQNLALICETVIYLALLYMSDERSMSSSETFTTSTEYTLPKLRQTQIKFSPP